MRRSLAIPQMVAEEPKSYYRGCSGKQVHSSRKLASSILRKIRLQGGDKQLALHPYKCNFCKGWHLGH